MIQITDAARDKLSEVLKENSGKYLRVFLKSG